MYPGGQVAYDRAITVFSPDGRIFQVEYAREAVKRGATAVGIVYKTGVLLAVDKTTDYKLLVPDSIEKIYQIDGHIGAASSGLIADARRIVEEARLEAQRNKIVYDEDVTVSELTRKVSNLAQAYTQYGGIRPLGCSLLIAGITNGDKQLYETDPSGAYSQYLATGIGSGKREAEKFFEKEYKKDLSKKEAIKLAVKALKHTAGGKLPVDNIDLATIEDEDEGFKLLDNKELQSIIKV